jgi:hypothetical protein
MEFHRGARLSLLTTAQVQAQLLTTEQHPRPDPGEKKPCCPSRQRDTIDVRVHGIFSGLNQPVSLPSLRNGWRVH